MRREQTNAMWRDRWLGAREAGLKMTAYAEREGFRATSAYRWRRRAIASGEWTDAFTKSGKAVTVTEPVPTVQFARVRVSELPAGPRCTVLRLTLTNGRRAELEVEIAQLAEVLDALERRA